MKPLKIIVLSACVLTGAHRAGAQDVQAVNVDFYPDGEHLVITYDLVGQPGKRDVIRVLISRDGGQSYTFEPETVAGHVGEGVPPGRGRQIVWSVLADLPEGIDDDLRIRILLEPAGKRRGLLILLGGALVAGAGGTVALLLGGGGDENPGNDSGDMGKPPLPPAPDRPSGN